MYFKFTPKPNGVPLPLLACDVGYQKLLRTDYEPNCWPFYQFVCCYKGEGLYLMQGQSFPLTEGSVIFMKPGVHHQYAKNGGACFVSWVSFDGFLIEQLCQSSGLFADSPFAIIQDRTHPNLHLDIMSVFEYAEDPFALERISAVLYQIAIEFMLQLKHNGGSARIPDRDRQEKRLEAAIDWMKQNVGAPADIAQLAEKLHISRQHLCRLFQQKFGVSTKEYMTKLKILQAQKDLVEFAEKSVADVAESLGFVNTSHFARVFKQVTGVSPNAFRESFFFARVIEQDK